MNLDFSSITFLASADSGYLYGLFFIITTLILGAATRHFLSKVPLPFTVLLLIFGLGIGALNRFVLKPKLGTDVTHGNHAAQHHDNHGSQGDSHVKEANITPDSHFNNKMVQSHKKQVLARGGEIKHTNRELTLLIGNYIKKMGTYEMIKDQEFLTQYDRLKAGYYAEPETAAPSSHTHGHQETASHHGEDEHHEKEGFWATVSHSIEWGGNLDPHLLLFVFLPILIFEAAFAMDVHTFKKSFVNALYLAGPGIITAMAMTGAAVWAMVHFDIGIGNWDWKPTPNSESMVWFLCMLFGAVVSATDPVAVVALLKELGASKKLGTLIEGESLLNDGTAIVLFVVLFAVVTLEEQFSVPNALLSFTKIAFVGAILGFIIGGITIVWVKKVFNDPLVEISLIVAAAYLTFYVAEHFLHISGVLGLVALGVAMASVGRTRISPEVEHFLHEFWELAAFIANILIFVIVGVVIAQRTNPTLSDFGVLMLVYILIHLVRAINMAIFYPFMKKTGYGLPPKDAIVVWWGALRGAIGLALALVVAGETLHSGAANPIPQVIRDQFLFYISGIVLLTLLVNATTVSLLVNYLGLTKIPAIKKVMMRSAYQAISTSGENELEVLKGDRFMGGANWSRVRNAIPRPHMSSPSAKELAELDSLSEIRRRILEKEKSSYWNQFKEGLLSAQAVSRLSNNISEVLDSDGKIPLTKRDYLDHLCGKPTLLEALQSVPAVSKIFTRFTIERLTMSYDVAKGFVVAQEEVGKLVSSFAKDLAGGGDHEEIAQVVTQEVQKNRIRGLNYLKEMHENYPEITIGIETKQAIRSILNHEKSHIQKLKKEGSIEADEAARLLVNIEERIKTLMNQALVLALPTPAEVLREVSWMKGIDESIIGAIVNAAQEREYNPGDTIMEQGDPGDGMILITRGSAQVSIAGHVVDLVGRGSVIGEMAVLTGLPRTASVTADTTVFSIWLGADEMQNIMSKSNELATSLWKTAGSRFAENILSNSDNFRNWSQHQLRRWLATGHIVAAPNGQTVNLYGKVAVLVAGSANIRDVGDINAPALLSYSEATFNDDAKVFFCESPNA